jgi:uncharacterized protein YaaQ
MKMIIAIVNDNDSESVSQALTKSSFRVTTIASTGGFLRRGQTTLLCGVEDDQLNKALEVIRSKFPPDKSKVETRCTLFVLNVAETYHY